MLTEKEVIDRLFELPEHFNRCMKNKEYIKAKNIYDNAVYLCVFFDVPEEMKITLFGNRPYAEDWEEIRAGLFREEDVLLAYKETFTSMERQISEERQNRERLGERIIYRGLVTKK